MIYIYCVCLFQSYNACGCTCSLSVYICNYTYVRTNLPVENNHDLTMSFYLTFKGWNKFNEHIIDIIYV